MEGDRAREREKGSEFFVARKTGRAGLRVRERYYRKEEEIRQVIEEAARNYSYPPLPWSIPSGSALSMFLDVFEDECLPLVVVSETALRQAREEKEKIRCLKKNQRNSADLRRGSVLFFLETGHGFVRKLRRLCEYQRSKFLYLPNEKIFEWRLWRNDHETILSFDVRQLAHLQQILANRFGVDARVVASEEVSDRPSLTIEEYIEVAAGACSGDVVENRSRLMSVAESVREVAGAARRRTEAQTTESREPSTEELFDAVRRGEALQGVVRALRSTSERGFVEVKGERRQLDNLHILRVLDGDEVVVSTTKGMMGILKRTRREVVATLKLSAEEEEGLASGGSGRRAFVCAPLETCLPLVRISLNNPLPLLGQRLLIAIDEWPHGSRLPVGHFLRMIGPIGNLETEARCLLWKHGIRDTPFSAAAMARLPSQESLAAVIADEVQRGRLDLRDDLVLSIDPKGCVDIDDALSYRELEDGSCEVGVHIADVTQFLEESSPLDNEAKARATSVYLSHRRIDMLPTVLATDLCSLRSSSPRLAVSAIAKLRKSQNGKFNVEEMFFGRTAIWSAAELSYEDAEAILDAAENTKEDRSDSNDALLSRLREKSLRKRLQELRFPPSAVAKSLEGLRQVARWLAEKRQERGAVEFATSELSVKTAGVEAQPSGVSVKTAREIHGVVAELMLFANEEVATYLYRTLGNAALLRRHLPPGSRKAQEMTNVLVSLGFRDSFVEADLRDSLRLSNLLRCLQPMMPDEAFKSLQLAIVQGMEEAEYVAAEKQTVSGGDQASLRHFGLAAPLYTHFTSPIRRYADVIVHRQLLRCVRSDPHIALAPAWRAALGTKANSQVDSETQFRWKAQKKPSKANLYEQYCSAVRLAASSTAVSSIASHINDRHRRGKAVQADCVYLFLCYFAAKAPLEQRRYLGSISAISEKQVTVSVGDLQLQDTISVAEVAEQLGATQWSLKHSTQGEDKQPVVETIVLQTAKRTVELRPLDTIFVVIESAIDRLHFPRIAVRLDPSSIVSQNNILSKSTAVHQMVKTTLAEQERIVEDVQDKLRFAKRQKRGVSLQEKLASFHEEADMAFREELGDIASGDYVDV